MAVWVVLVRSRDASRSIGNGYHLGMFFPIYDWMRDDGFADFGRWVG